MDSERRRRAREICYAAFEHKLEGERVAFLEAACRGDDDLRREVESLLVQLTDASHLPNGQPADTTLTPPFGSREREAVVGRHLGPYEIEAVLGTGGMGQVYRARDTRLGRRVAIKTAHAPFTERVEREARACAALNHPHICTLYDIGPNYLVMELVEGETLAARLKKGPLPLPSVFEYGVQIADALAIAHARGIVHRDLKPGNVMITPSGVKVLDFGLAKSQQDETITSAGMIIGTPAYMAPEQRTGGECDGRTDLYALGVVLYEMATGRKALPDHPVPMEGLPPPLVHIIQRCLLNDPAQRWQTATDLKAELEWAGKPQHPPERERRSRWPTSRVSALSVLVIGLAALVAGIVLWQRFRRVERPENPLAGAQITRLTDFAGMELDPAVSPDGKFVAFISDHDGTFDLWLSQAGTGNLQNLTKGKVDDVQGPLRDIGFSGDGSEIWIAGKQGRRLRMLSLIGGTLRNFLGEDAAEVAWSPDAKRLVYHSWETGDAMFTADGNGANIRPLLVAGPADEHRHFPVWSQDGRWIYFVRGRPATREMDLWRISPEGGKPQRLTWLNRDIGYPTPIDARTLLYTARDMSGAGPWLWALDIETKSSQRLSMGFDQYTALAADAGGRRVAASVVTTRVGLWSIPILDRPATEHDVQPFPLPNARSLAPRFAGGTLFYLSSRDGADGLWTYRDGQNQEIWKGSDGALLSPAAISPDGGTVAIALRRNDRFVWHVLASDGTQLRPLSAAVDARGTASWSPDGKWIVSGGSDSGGPGLFKIPIAGGPPVRLHSGPALDPVWSPDGSLIVYGGANVFTSMPLAAVRPDGSVADLPPITVRREGERFRFLPGGKGLVYMQGEEGPQEFWLLDLATRKSRPLSQLNDTATMRSFDITSDGKRIVFDRFLENSDILVIDLADSRQ